jgi:hypothetical protein
MRETTDAGWDLRDYEHLEDWVAQLRNLPPFPRLADLILGLRLVATSITVVNMANSWDEDGNSEEEPEVNAPLNKGKQREEAPPALVHVPGQHQEAAVEAPSAVKDQQREAAAALLLQDQGLLANDPPVSLSFGSFFSTSNNWCFFTV